MYQSSEYYYNKKDSPAGCFVVCMILLTFVVCSVILFDSAENKTTPKRFKTKYSEDSFKVILDTHTEDCYLSFNENLIKASRNTCD